MRPIGLRAGQVPPLQLRGRPLIRAGQVPPLHLPFCLV